MKRTLNICGPCVLSNSLTTTFLDSTTITVSVGELDSSTLF